MMGSSDHVKIAFGIALSISAITVTHAGNFSNAVSDQRQCEALGEMAVSTYKSRKAPGAKKKALEGTTPSPNDDAYIAEAKKVMYLAQTYALDKASSPKDAYMTAWGYCMDRGR